MARRKEITQLPLAAAASRLYFLDNLKVALTCLVIAHHAGQPYGGSGGFWYYQPEGGPELQLGRFFSVNAGFFMSLFFLISAYFLPASYERKGAGGFLKDRLERLGVPALLGFLFVVPIMMYAYYVNFRGYGNISFWAYYLNVCFGLEEKPAGWTGPSWPDMQFAHLWFLEHLLFYAVVYTIVRKWIVRRPIMQEGEKPLRSVTIAAFAAGLALVTAAVRIRFDLDYWFGFLGFIQAEFFHVPQYAAFFIVGLVARRNNWMMTLTRRVGLTWLLIGVSLALTYYLGGIQVQTRSGWNTDNLVFACYETFMCTGLCVGLIYLFRVFASSSTSFLKRLTENAFAVYIIHVPVLVVLQYMLGALPVSMLVQFILSVVLGISCSFALSHFVIRRMPYFKRIL